MQLTHNFLLSEDLQPGFIREREERDKESGAMREGLVLCPAVWLQSVQVVLMNYVHENRIEHEFTSPAPWI